MLKKFARKPKKKESILEKEKAIYEKWSKRNREKTDPFLQHDFPSGDSYSKDEIREAIEYRSYLRITYMGGTQPGATRMITPIRFEGRNVRARCHNSNMTKLFTVSKIKKSDGTEMEWRPKKTIGN